MRWLETSLSWAFCQQVSAIKVLSWKHTHGRGFVGSMWNHLAGCVAASGGVLCSCKRDVPKKRMFSMLMFSFTSPVHVFNRSIISFMICILALVKVFAESCTHPPQSANC